MKLTAVVPVFNEEKTVKKVINKLINIKSASINEIIIVNDGSTDNTAREIGKIKSPKIKIVTHVKNVGKGSAIKSAVRLAKGDFILIQDADLEYNPNEIFKLLRPLKKKSSKGKEDIAVYGSRFMANNAIIPKVYFWGNKLLTIITNLLYGVKLSDMETGYKIIPAGFFKKNELKSRYFDIEPEITAKLIKDGIKILEIPISYHGRSHFAGKKLTVRDAYGALKALLYFRFFN